MKRINDGLTRAERHRLKCLHPCETCGEPASRLARRCADCYAQVRKKQLRERPPQLRHGYARSGNVFPVHSIWRCMLARCSNPNNPRFATYGARGIRVHPRWLVFENFLADVGERPPGKTPGGRAAYQLDRIDNDGNYEPGNVRWVHYTEQPKRQTSNILITAGGRTMIAADWAAELGMNPKTLRARIRAGWDGDRAISESTMKNGVSPALYLFRGERLALNEIADRVGIPRGTLKTRLARGKSLKDACSL